MKEKIKQMACIITGSAVFAVAVSFFLEPARIAPGGLTGIGLIINHLAGFPTGVTIIVLNIPLFILGGRKFGMKFLGRTMFATVLSSLLLDFLGRYRPVTEDVLLAALYGGVLLGLGLGLVFSGEATTGGTDIIVKLLKLRFPALKTGRLVLFVDAAVILLSVVVFHDINRALYAAIALYVASLVFDMVVYRFDFASLVYIISECPDKIVPTITEEMERGVTFLSGRGGFTGKSRDVLFVAVKRTELPTLYAAVEAADPDAFVIAMDAHQVYGEGFESYRPKKLK